MNLDRYVTYSLRHSVVVLTTKDKKDLISFDHRMIIGITKIVYFIFKVASNLDFLRQQ